ncbi:MFS transporter [Microbacterium esteraromaticum]|nr:MFS transporter [Microbacterium esteraromaticum]
MTHTPTSRPHPAALLVIATTQLMLVLDDTIANIALPAIAEEFTLASAALPWVINAYILVFGGLLLLGGKLGDVLGRRRVLVIGLAVFTAASAVAGLSWSGEALIDARAVQGLGAALAAPNLLALIATTFEESPARNKALAVYGAMSGLGIIGGVLLGGLLASTLGWRSVFLINIPVGVALLLGTRVLGTTQPHRQRLDLPSAIVGTVGLIALVFAITQASELGWAAPLVLISGIVGIVLLVVFVIMQRTRTEPMLPLTVFHDLSRSASYLVVLFIGAGLMGTFYLLTLYFQNVAGMDQMMTGLAFLPFSFGVIIASVIGGKLAERLPARLIAATGLVIAAGGLFWLATITPESSYFPHLAIALFLAALGLGGAFVVLTLTAVRDLPVRTAGIGSSLVNSAQQIGAALGLAIFTAVSVAASAMDTHGDTRTALAAGYGTAFGIGAALMLVGSIIVAVGVRTPRPQEHQ